MLIWCTFQYAIPAKNPVMQNQLEIVSAVQQVRDFTLKSKTLSVLYVISDLCILDRVLLYTAQLVGNYKMSCSLKHFAQGRSRGRYLWEKYLCTRCNMFLMLHEAHVLTPRLPECDFFPSEHLLPYPTGTSLRSSHPCVALHQRPRGRWAGGRAGHVGEGHRGVVGWVTRVLLAGFCSVISRPIYFNGFGSAN